MTSSEDVQFGQAAVELGHCTAAQVRECLAEQEQRRRLGERVVLGFLLVEMGYLSPDDVPAVLKQQKRQE
ncbi:MAG: hypothetical protein IIB29_15660, partial [Chloroflexi bacterium]|nr:hypothetical protein [Chloroflexota bacterium]